MKGQSQIPPARLFERHLTKYAAMLLVHPDHAEQFRLSHPNVQADIAVVDVSKGGVGLACGFYLPKNLRLSVNVSDVADGDAPRSNPLVIRAAVRRCTMIDHKPSYFVGLEFLDPDGADERALILAASAGGIRGPEMGEKLP